MTFLEIKSGRVSQWINLRYLEFIRIIPAIDRENRVKGYYIDFETTTTTTREYVKGLSEEQIKDLVSLIESYACEAQNNGSKAVTVELDGLVKKVKGDNNGKQGRA